MNWRHEEIWIIAGYWQDKNGYERKRGKMEMGGMIRIHIRKHHYFIAT